MACDEIATHIKITDDRKSQSVNQVFKARKIYVLPREVLEIWRNPKSEKVYSKKSAEAIVLERGRAE